MKHMYRETKAPIYKIQQPIYLPLNFQAYIFQTDQGILQLANQSSELANSQRTDPLPAI